MVAAKGKVFEKIKKGKGLHRERRKGGKKTTSEREIG